MRIALLNCYFGMLPNYFELWLQSCAANPEIDFILITDANISAVIPQNVRVISSSWDDLVKRIDDKFDFDVSIKSPYKLTDFKPAYGYIFSELFKSYDYWGYCDIDMIFGNLMKFIKKPIEDGYEKIYRLGHLTIYKNTEEMRNLFRKKGAMFSYKKVFSNPEFYSFDEHAGQMLIAKKQGVKEYYQEDMADISCRIKRMTASRHENYPYQVFYYDGGSVWRSYIKNETIESEEFAYIHIQKRKYKFDRISNLFYILGDHFVNKKSGVPERMIIKKLSEFVGEESDLQQLTFYRKKKVKDFITCSLREKIIWIKIKIAEKRAN